MCLHLPLALWPVLDTLHAMETMRETVHRELTEATCRGMGYSFDAERIDRLSKESLKIMNLGSDFTRAFSAALEVDLMLYGDPQASQQAIEGILKHVSR